jgi:hypothetical protein
MPNKKSTSARVAKTAAKALKNSGNKSTRQLAESPLSQTETRHVSSKRMRTLAGKVLKDLKSTKIARELAASVLVQG